MNCKELQIGDWVFNSYHKYNIRIAAEDFFTHIHQCDGTPTFIGMPFAPSPVSGRDFKSIKLSDEILRLNNFKVAYNYEDKHIGLCNRYTLENFVEILVVESYDTMTSAGTETRTEDLWELHISYDGFFSKESDHLYVHELQHALRLCGLRHIADELNLY